MKVLLVDDHALFLQALKMLLTANNYEVVGTAADGLEALQQARLLRPELILMDIEMPGCDGLAATRLIKAEMPQIKIVILTVYLLPRPGGARWGGAAGRAGRPIAR
jgi:DNA-binding NarL/FixJ family response regulator